ncbi:dienelactone hydrolase family protein [Alteraurantiacibacter aquimixticola]|nr:dienelactone hydrolase family protein [Alteraurantiacibacter aquimixticola]
MHLARRALAAICALCLAACTTLAVGSAEPAVRSVRIATAGGMADAILAVPEGPGSHPAVILWPDLSGLRPSYRELAGKLAGEGFVVLVPNSFHRSIALDGSAATAQPVLPFGEVMRRGAPWREAADDAAIMADAQAYARYLDTLPQVDGDAGLGTLGVDIGGAHAFLAARALPERVRAVAAIHPLAIATSRENSPHLFVAQSRAQYLIEIARPDDEREPGDKDDLRTAFADAGLASRIDIVDAGHGYFMPDDPAFDSDLAEAGFGKIVALFEEALE